MLQKISSLLAKYHQVTELSTEVRMWIGRRIKKPLGNEADMPVDPNGRVHVSVEFKDEEGKTMELPAMELDTTETILFGRELLVNLRQRVRGLF